MQKWFINKCYVIAVTISHRGKQASLILLSALATREPLDFPLFWSLKWLENYLLLKDFWQSEGKIRTLITDAELSMVFVSKICISHINFYNILMRLKFCFKLASLKQYHDSKFSLIFLQNSKIQRTQIVSCKNMHNWGNL